LTRPRRFATFYISALEILLLTYLLTYWTTGAMRDVSKQEKLGRNTGQSITRESNAHALRMRRECCRCRPIIALQFAVTCMRESIAAVARQLVPVLSSGRGVASRLLH